MSAPRGGWRATVGGIALIVALALPGCESGPSGPGSLNGSITGAERSAGAAVIEVRGAGVTGFSGRAGTRVYSAPLGEADAYRVVVVGVQAGSELTFSVEVSDLADDPPVASVIQVAGEDNRPAFPLSDYQVRISH